MWTWHVSAEPMAANFQTRAQEALVMVMTHLPYRTPAEGAGGPYTLLIRWLPLLIQNASLSLTSVHPSLCQHVH